jgi:hypothetical protein
MMHRHRNHPNSPTRLADDLYRFTTAELVEAMRQANVDPALVYAFRKTGFIPTEGTLELFTPEELEEWDAALAEYRTHLATKGAGA